MNSILHERAVEYVKNYKRCESDLVRVLEEIDRSKLYLHFGVSSLFRYCVEKLSLSEAETYRFIQVMRKAIQVPELKHAIGSGLLTVSKASRIAPVVSKDNEKIWIEKAAILPYRELEREIAKEFPKPEQNERVKILTPVRSELRFSVSVELERKLKRAKEVLNTKSMEETLERLIDYTLQRKDPMERARRTAARHCRTTGAGVKPSISHQPAKPAARQASVAKQLRRPIPQGIRHTVTLRDNARCTVKGCQETRWVEMHHIRPVSRGGDHSLENLTTLCSGHHSLMHGHQRSKWAKTPRG